MNNDDLKQLIDKGLRYLEAKRANREPVTDKFVRENFHLILPGVTLLWRDRRYVMGEIRRQFFMKWFDINGDPVPAGRQTAVFSIAPCFHSSMNSSPVETRDGFWLKGPDDLVNRANSSEGRGRWCESKAKALQDMKRPSMLATTKTAEELSHYYQDFTDALRKHFPHLKEKLDQVNRIREEREAEEERKREEDWKTSVRAGVYSEFWAEAIDILRGLVEPDCPGEHYEHARGFINRIEAALEARLNPKKAETNDNEE